MLQVNELLIKNPIQKETVMSIERNQIIQKDGNMIDAETTFGMMKVG